MEFTRKELDPQTAEAQTLTVTAARLADMFNVSPRTIRQYVSDGVLERETDGSFCVFTSTQRYLAFLLADRGRML